VLSLSDWFGLVWTHGQGPQGAGGGQGRPRAEGFACNTEDFAWSDGSVPFQTDQSVERLAELWGCSKNFTWHWGKHFASGE